MEKDILLILNEFSNEILKKYNHAIDRNEKTLSLDDIIFKYKELLDNILQCKSIEFIPYQTCPICNGCGQIKVLGNTTIIDEICPTCKSTRIISMHKNTYHGKTNFT